MCFVRSHKALFHMISRGSLTATVRTESETLLEGSADLEFPHQANRGRPFAFRQKKECEKSTPTAPSTSLGTKKRNKTLAAFFGVPSRTEHFSSSLVPAALPAESSTCLPGTRPVRHTVAKTDCRALFSSQHARPRASFAPLKLQLFQRATEHENHIWFGELPFHDVKHHHRRQAHKHVRKRR